jgi:hypothetical protein
MSRSDLHSGKPQQSPAGDLFAHNGMRYIAGLSIRLIASRSDARLSMSQSLSTPTSALRREMEYLSFASTYPLHGSHIPLYAIARLTAQSADPHAHAIKTVAICRRRLGWSALRH